MKRQKAMRITCILLVLLMVAGLLASASFSVFGTVLEETPREKLDRIGKELQAIQSEIDQNKKDITKAQQVRQAYQKKMTLLEEQMTVLQETIATTESDLNKKEKELAQKVLDLQKTEDLFEARLQAMYIRGSAGNLEALLGVASFADMLRTAEDLQQISLSDTQLIEQLRAERAELEKQRSEIENTLATLDEQKQQLEATRVEYEEAIRQANIDISAAQAEQQSNEAAYKEKAEEYARQMAIWQEWAGATGATNPEYTGGPYKWPVPGYTRISSNFGDVRYIYGVRDVHRGIDIPAPAGTPIYAAADGVISTKNHWSYGVSVKISCSTSMTNIYGHMTARAPGVVDGAYAYKGMLIGYVGSTGNSTGNHLHFEVNINGVPVSPWVYFGQ